MYPNLEAERVSRGYTEEMIAKKLGISEQAYHLRMKSGTFELSEAQALAAFYDRPIEYLFQ
jgi:DNA-binding XRE family transcriptional regulator